MEALATTPKLIADLSCIAQLKEMGGMLAEPTIFRQQVRIGS